MPENTPATWATRKLKQLTSVLFRLFSAAGDRIRPILWSPEIKRPKTEPSLSSKNNNNSTLPALVSEPEKFTECQ